MKKYYYAKEVTCPKCEGLGFVRDSDFGVPEHDIDTIEAKLEMCPDSELEYWEALHREYYEYFHCEHCDGKGYVNDEIDPVTGYTIIEIQEGM